MKKIRIIFSSIIILSSISLAVEGETEKNTKYQFINDIYSESWALIIGINKYQNVDHLTYAVDDAVAVQEMLVDKYGFREDNIKLIIDEEATKDNIIKGFSDILTQAKEKDRVVVFYAGHGETYKLPTGGYMGYLIPVDGNLDNLYLSSIPMKSVYDIADMSYAKHILYLVDACYGGLTLATTRGLKKDTTPEYIKKMTQERGRQVITAGGKGEQVLEKAEWGHSAFTKSLLNGLGKGFADENVDGIITADELGSFIKNRVVVDVDGAHTPQKGRIGSDKGEFVFISETLDDQFADVSPSLGGEQLDNLEAEGAELKKLLKSQGQNRSSSKSVNMQTAAVLAWVFPDAGHYYSGRVGKGMLFTGLEIGSIASLIKLSSKYSELDEDYQNVLFNMDPNNNPELTQSEYDVYKIEETNSRKEKNASQIGMITAGTAAVGIWLWNTRDVKKNSSYSYSSSKKYSVGINPNRQVHFRINF